MFTKHFVVFEMYAQAITAMKQKNWKVLINFTNR